MTLGGRRAVWPHDVLPAADRHHGVLYLKGPMRKTFKIGVLYSLSGPYAPLGRECRDGAEFALEQCNRIAPGLIEPIFIDPKGNLQDYVEGARALLRDHGCRHVIGTITSAGRKEILPIVEKHDGLLWYTCPYEGFEANANVIYTGACPNQHLLPLFDYLLPRFGKRPYLLGANYVWGWEMNRLARELIAAAEGEIAGESVLPIDEIQVDRVMADIVRTKPSFVLNNFIGPSSYAFLAAMRQLAQKNPAFRPEFCPVVSCDLTECELPELGDNGEGQLSAASYFNSLTGRGNATFRSIMTERYGAGRKISSFFSTTFASLKMCIDAIHIAGTDEPLAVRQHLSSTTADTVLGPIRIDANTHHAALPFHLGRIGAHHDFDIIASLPAIAADPYLTARRISRRPQLRVVS
jgi:urea transport system substrate-binding protein